VPPFAKCLERSIIPCDTRNNPPKIAAPVASPAPHGSRTKHAPSPKIQRRPRFVKGAPPAPELGGRSRRCFILTS